MEKDRLICYAVTPRAMQIVLGEEAPPKHVPEGWFNWVGLAPKQPGGYNPQRLELVRFSGRGEAIARWCANAHAAGYGCALIASIDEDFQLEDVQGLRGDVAFCPITPSPFDANEHQLVQEMLREPEQAIVACWVAVKVGGGTDIDKVGFGEVTLSQWWAYGLGLREWIARTAKGQVEAHLRKRTPDFSRWTWQKGIPQTQLDLQWCWNSNEQFKWPWSLSRPCTRIEIPALDALDLSAYWPIRQMPCCGVALHRDGRLVAVGALTDDWAWDASGRIRAAFEHSRDSMAKQSPDRINMTPFTDNRDLLRRLLSFSRNPSQVIEMAASTEKKEPMPSSSSHSLFIQWEENFHDCIVQPKLIVSGEQVVLELHGSLPAGATPTAIRLRKSGRQWELLLKDDYWHVEGLERIDVVDILSRYCADGNGGQRFVQNGYELVFPLGY